MPRVNIASSKEKQINKFEGLFQEYRLNQRLETGEVAKRMGISPPTLRERRHNIDSFTVGEVKKLCKITGMPLKLTVGILYGLNLDN